MVCSCTTDVIVAATLLLLFITTTAECQSHDRLKINTPPFMHLQREWILPDTEPVGTVVTRVHAGDEENDKLAYGLEPGPIYGSPENANYNLPLPFAINNTTGVIHINGSLKERSGQNLFLYVTVSDGQLTSKAEVYVIIKNSSAPDNGDSGNLPFSSQHGTGSRLRPPFGLPPNLHNYPRAPSIPSHPPLSSIHSPSMLPKTTRLQPEILLSKNEVNKVKNKNEEENVNKKEEEEKIENMTNGRRGHKKNKSEGSKKDEEAVEKDGTANEIQGGPALSSKVAPSEVAPASQELGMILVPVAAVCALVLGFSMAVWSLRNRFCGSRKSKENTKEPACPSESNISDDPSLVLKKWRGPKAFSNRYEAWEKESQASTPNKSSKDIWEFPRHRIKVFSILGEGCFGQVYKCEARDIDGVPGPSIIAVKTVKKNATERERLDLLQELKVMKTLDPHPNVVRLLGCCTDREPMFVILEYVSGGKLQSFLRASREERNLGGSGLTSRDLTRFVHQVAKGMEYLASKGIIHRDLAARNILIDEDRTCKVADFGFARDIAINQIYERKSEGRLPIRWMAPESLYDNIFSIKSDIWSFGVLMWEIVTLGSTPYPGLGASEVMKKLREGYRLERPEHCKRELYNIMFYCWDKDPVRRPSFTELLSLTEGLLLDETDYIELDRFPDHSYYNVLNLSGEKL